MLQRWFLRIDLWSAWVFVWLFGLERRGLTTDDHRFFADRYQRLADLHRKRGHNRVATMLRAASLIIAPGREPFPGLVEIRDTASTDFARRTYRATGLVRRSITGANDVYVVPLLPGVYDSCEYPWRSAKC